MSNKFLKSKLTTLIKKEKHCEFKENLLSFAKKDPYGYRYMERIAKNPKDYNNKEIITYLKKFFKENKRYTRSKKKKQNKTKKKLTKQT